MPGIKSHYPTPELLRDARSIAQQQQTPSGYGIIMVQKGRAKKRSSVCESRLATIRSCFGLHDDKNRYASNILNKLYSDNRKIIGIFDLNFQRRHLAKVAKNTINRENLYV